VKVDEGVIAELSVKSSPEVPNEEPVPFKLPWLFDTDAEEPGGTPAVNPVPALL
jgi:hypothetical protein